MRAEAYCAERCRSEALEVVRVIDPAREELAEADVLVNARRQSFLPEIAQDHPELERAETATERSAIVHQVHDLLVATLSVAQVFGDQTEGGLDDLRPASVEDAAIDRGEEPFMRVDDQRIGALAAVQCPAHGWIDGSRAAIRTIDMQPEAVSRADSGDLRHGVYAGGRGRADRSHDGERQPADRNVFLNGLLKPGRVHTKLVVYAYFAQPLLSDAEHDTSLLD